MNETLDRISKGQSLKSLSAKTIYDSLQLLNEDEIRSVYYMMGIWNITKEHINVLFTPQLIDLLPDDFELTCVISYCEKNKLVKDMENCDFDTRYGMTAYGVRIKR